MRRGFRNPSIHIGFGFGFGSIDLFWEILFRLCSKFIYLFELFLGINLKPKGMLGIEELNRRES